MAMNGAGTTIAVGSSGYDGSNNAINSGHVRVFDLDLDASNWLQRGDAIEGEFAYDNSGTSVVLSEDGMVVGIGEPQSDAGKNTEDRMQIDFGQVRVFEWMENDSVIFHPFKYSNLTKVNLHAIFCVFSSIALGFTDTHHHAVF